MSTCIPRINRALCAFQDGWNHHGIRTASNLSPQQLFTQAALRLHSSGLVALDFFDKVSDDFGISDDDPMPAAESESVVVPEVQFSLQDTAFQQLKETIDPLQQSDSYGIDIYTSVKVFISSYTHKNFFFAF